MTLVLAACGSSGGGTTDPGTGNPGPNPTPNPVTKFDCQNPLGGVVKHGESVSLFKAPKVDFGQQCQSEFRTCDNGVLSGTHVHALCDVLPEGEPATHEKPMKLSDEGLKMGGVKLVGTQWVTRGMSRSFSPPPPARPLCATQPVLGQICKQGTPVCMLGDVDYSCEQKRTLKVWGWIYEKNGLDYSKMAEGVSVDIWWFAGCLAGMCSPFAGPVKTDKWGYFELTTETLLDTLRIEGLPKYHMFCKNGQPISGGGQYITSFEGKAIGPFKQLLVNPDSCKED